ncbi:MAG: M15 family metallopeptidase [Oscillospiraceae bacterium]|nr:M15 family metallopeptidase [Oscillospiraceae bacterium]
MKRDTYKIKVAALFLVLAAGVTTLCAALLRGVLLPGKPAASEITSAEAAKTADPAKNSPKEERTQQNNRTSEAVSTSAAVSLSTEAPPSGPSGGDTAADGKYAYEYPGIHPAVAVFRADSWNLLLVNRHFALPADYAPEIAVAVPGVYPEERELDARAAAAYQRMYYAALRDGAELVPFSGYRYISTQKTNFDRKVGEYRAQGFSEAQAVQLTAQSILPPGCSEHEAGLAMDITAPGKWGADEGFEKTAEFRWLSEHADAYGFILRYPKDKQEITEITYEPWHWRYVGPEAAKAIKAAGLCLEEWLDRRP